MSGASGKVPAAIHVTPEAKEGGPIARIQEGDIVRIDAINGKVEVLVEDIALKTRVPAHIDLSDNEFGLAASSSLVQTDRRCGRPRRKRAVPLGKAHSDRVIAGTAPSGLPAISPTGGYGMHISLQRRASYETRKGRCSTLICCMFLSFNRIGLKETCSSGGICISRCGEACGWVLGIKPVCANIGISGHPPLIRLPAPSPRVVCVKFCKIGRSCVLVMRLDGVRVSCALAGRPC